MVYRTEAKLFESGDFTSHAGLKLKWKLECDAISPDEWKTIARMIMDYQTQPFYEAVGIPRGGLALAHAMNEYASGDPTHQTMICDDVFTTGTSMREFIDEKYPNWLSAMGYRWVVFARQPCSQHPHNVRALFTMPENHNKYD